MTSADHGPRRVFVDASDAVHHLVRELGLPFTVYSIGPREAGLHLHVPPGELDDAHRFFEDHPLHLQDGTRLSVEIEPRRGAVWKVEPVAGVRQVPDPIDDAELLGQPVDVATQRATARGWLVRAHERGGLLARDFRRNRINLTLDDDHVVVRVSRG